MTAAAHIVGVENVKPEDRTGFILRHGAAALGGKEFCGGLLRQAALPEGKATPSSTTSFQMRVISATSWGS